MKLLHNLYLLDGTGYWAPRANCNVYVLDVGDSLVMIDAGHEKNLPYALETMKYWGLAPEKISHVLITHSHLDHAGGAAALREMGVKVVACGSDADGIEAGDERIGTYFCTDDVFRPCKVDLKVSDGDKLTYGDFEIEVINAPGHTRGSAIYRCTLDGKEAMFTGDTVLNPLFYAGGGANQVIYGGLGWQGSFDFSRDAYTKTLKRLWHDYKPEMLFPAHNAMTFTNGHLWIGHALNYVLEFWRK